VLHRMHERNRGKNDYLDCREQANGFWLRSSANQKGVMPKYG
jgi:hypothetical protein